MSSYDKVVKLACKPKNAPPKPKYIDNIIAATWSEDGAVHDICKALASRFREPNSIVVFKALIVLHTMVRSGSVDNVLSFLSQSDVLKLRNVYTGSWEGFANPDHLHGYAKYLDCRIRAYKDLKHDIIKVQAESNRDARNSISVDEDGYRSKKDAGRNKKPNLARSRTLMGRKLRSMTVEKGLLRETRVVIQMMDSLVECRFYIDGVDDELRITALRMLVRDLLILYQAANEAVINLLEQYFEMSHVDAAEALAIYRHFCKLTEHVNEYLGVAKKLQNLLGVSIPHLGTAPLSLAKSLQEYLDDANFESNRLEYRKNKLVADGKTGPSRNKAEAASSSKPGNNTKPSTSTPVNPATSSASATQEQVKASIDDFFSSIEENQAPPQTTSPTGFLQQPAPNPFSQTMNNQPFGFPQMTAQPTGFLMPQHTAMPMNTAVNPFGQSNARPFSTFGPAQQQQNYLQPQATGINPFRQSMLVPQTTGMALFGVGGNSGLSSPQSNPFPQPNQTSLQPMATGVGMFGQPFQPNQNLFGMSSSQSQPIQPAPASGSFAAPFGAPSAQANVPPRPASTPLTAFNNSSTSQNSNSTSPPAAQPVKTHQTGTKNPFGPIVVTPPPPMPKGPTLMELAMGTGSNPGAATGTNMGRSVSGPLLGTSTGMNASGPSQPVGQSQTNGTSGSGFNFANSALNPGGTDMASVASSFAFGNSNAGDKGGLDQSNGNANATGSTISDSLFSNSGLSSQRTGVTTVSATSSLPTGIGSGVGTSGSGFVSPTGAGNTATALKPQMTGFAGLKPFKPTSSFGASLMESLPPIPTGGPNNGASDLGKSGPAPGAATNVGTNTANSMSQSPFPMGTLNAQPTGFGGFNTTGNFTPGSNMTGTNSATPPSQPFSSNMTSTSRLGAGLRPQLTGGGVANPFRASMAAYGSGSGGTNVPAVPPLPTGFGTSGSTFGTFGGNMNAFGQQQQQQPGTQGAQTGQHTASLI